MGIDISNKNIWVLELMLTTKEDGDIHDRIVCGVYLRAVFISLAVDIGGSVYLRAVFNGVNTVCVGKKTVAIQ